MPNWCSCTMAVYGSPAEVKDFKAKCELAREKGDKLKHWHLYQIFEEFGYKEKEILEGDNTYGYNRGSIDDISDISKLSDTEDVVTIYYESAWDTMIDGWDYLIKNHYKTLKSETIAEECGNEVYINTDRTGRFFNERYVIYIEDWDSFYFDNGEEQKVVDTFNEYIEKKQLKFEKLETIKDCYDFIEDNSPDDIGYVSLNEFGPY